MWPKVSKHYSTKETISFLVVDQNFLLKKRGSMQFFLPEAFDEGICFKSV